MKTGTWTRHIEVLLWTAGLGCASFCALATLRAHQSSVLASRIEHSEQPTFAAREGNPAKPAGEQQPPVASVIGRMEVPRLHLTVPVLSDYEPDSLRRGVGHIQGTAFPGGLGTVGLAGHRDTFLRPLRGVVPGMEIRLVDRSGAYLYRVDRTEIVTPDQVHVLDITTRPELAVVTCYPFYYVGSAPKRFIVHAHLLSLVPEQAAATADGQSR